MATKTTYTRESTNKRWTLKETENIRDYELAVNDETIDFMKSLGGREIRIDSNHHRSISPDGLTAVEFSRYDLIKEN